MQESRVIVKAPGKVMLAGGYAVLQEGNLGLTLAVDQYFFSISSKVDSSQINNTSTQVVIESPQIGLKWQYVFTPGDNSIKENNNQVNVFLENAVKYSLIFAFSFSQNVKNTSIHIIVLQDRGFLSEPQSQCPSQNRFINYSAQSTKTGLGSSAGVMVVTVTAILRQLFGNLSKETINVVSQVANLAAQNKIGSNFDISTAVFGSHLYHNLLPREAFKASNTLNFQPVLSINPQVGSLIVKCQKIRKGFCCMLDLKKGSNTRKMVSGFIKTLNEQSPQIISDFYRTSKATVQKIYKLLVQEEREETLIPQLKCINYEYRQFLQKYSAITNIPVQPSQLSPFLDDICKIDNIIYAICPGSGGYDAIFLLSTAQTQSQIISFKDKLKQVCSVHKVQADINDTKILWGQPQVQQEDILAINKFLKL